MRNQYADYLPAVYPGDPIKAEDFNLIRRIISKYTDLPNSDEDSFGISMIAKADGGGYGKIYTCTLTADLNSGSSAAATLLIGPDKDQTGKAITVHDTPAFITAGKKLSSGTKCRVFRDRDMKLPPGNYALLVPDACEVDQ